MELEQRPAVLKTKTDHDKNLKQMWLDIEVRELLSRLAEDGVATVKTQYTTYQTVMLSGKHNGTAFLVSVNVSPSRGPQEQEHRDIDDYFSGQEDASDTEEFERTKTRVLLHPYAKMDALAEETDRDYISEKDAALDYIALLASN